MLFAKETDAKFIKKTLSENGLSIFYLNLRGVSELFRRTFFIHKSKTRVYWREDINNFLSCYDFKKQKRSFADGNDDIYYDLLSWLENLDYVNIDDFDLITDSFTADIISERSKIVPSNEDYLIEGFELK